MSDKEKPAIGIDGLHAYADGQVSLEKAIAVEAYLQSNPEAAAQVRDYQEINEALKSAFPLDEVVPVRPVRRLNRLAMAATLAGMLLGGAAGWISHAQFGSGDQAAMSTLAQRATAAYVVYAPDTKHPVEVTGSESGHLAAWLSKRMNMTFTIPQLNEAGFTLVGGRLMVGDTAPAAMLMYENGQGRRIVLYVRNDLPDDPPSKMRYRHTDAGGIVYWRDTAVGYGLAGGFTEQELMPVANLIRRDLSS